MRQNLLHLILQNYFYVGLMTWAANNTPVRTNFSLRQTRSMKCKPSSLATTVRNIRSGR